MSFSASQQAYFNEVWNFVRQVPPGKLVTYGQIAMSLPQPQDFDFNEQTVSTAQLVGSAMAMCPADVPWHRVINAQGRVSSRAGASKQLQLLEAEGLNFVQGRVDLNQHQWQGPNEADAPKQHRLF
jgi:methylated-DNA-protein-cysteine methyltransferase-like protein